MTPLPNDHADDRPIEPGRLARLEALLGGLERRQAPRVLRERVAGSLAAAPDGAELERRTASAVAALEPLRAPAELRERVALELSTRTPVAGLVRGLERQRPPHVLRRLVEEEVGDDAAHLKRFAGSLPRLSHPQVEPAAGGGTVHRAPFGSASWRSVAAAAAALFAVGALALGSRDLFGGSDDPHADRPPLRLERRTVASLDELSPMARGFAEGFALDAPGATTDGGAR